LKKVPWALQVPEAGAGAELRQQREQHQVLPEEQAEARAGEPVLREQAGVQVLRERAEVQPGEPVFRMTYRIHRRKQFHQGFLFRN
jgi:hypothetical protein